MELGHVSASQMSATDIPGCFSTSTVVHCCCCSAIITTVDICRCCFYNCSVPNNPNNMKSSNPFFLGTYRHRRFLAPTDTDDSFDSLHSCEPPLETHFDFQVV